MVKNKKQKNGIYVCPKVYIIIFSAEKGFANTEKQQMTGKPQITDPTEVSGTFI